MHNVWTVGLSLCIVAFAACNTTSYPYSQFPEERAEANAAMVKGLAEQGVRNAVIEQHTLFPYHFVGGQAQLTYLGERDLQFLADAYRTAGGNVNVQQGGVSDALYRQRIDVVLAYLESKGIDRASLSVTDGEPGGRGATAERIVEILK